MTVGAAPAGAYSNLWSAESAPTNYPSGIPTLRAVSCPSAAVCYAVGDVVSNTGKAAIVYSSNANTASPTWASQSSPATTALRAISCTSVATCYAAGDSTIIYTTNSGTGWASTAGSPNSSNPNKWTGISCVAASPQAQSTDTCFAVAGIDSPLANGYAIAQTTNGGGSWTSQSLPAGYTTPLTSISCPATTVCVAGGMGGSNIFQYNGSWRSFSVPPNQDQLPLGLGCLVASIVPRVTAACTAAPAPAFDIGGVSCSSVHTCYAVQINGNNGSQATQNVWVDSHLNSGDTGDTWAPTAGATNNNAYQYGISCVAASPPSPSTDTCFTVGGGDPNNGSAVSVMHTANGGGSWDALQASGVKGTLYGVSCHTTSCQAVGSDSSSNAAAITHN